MTNAHQTTLLALAQEQGIEAIPQDAYIPKWSKGKKTVGVVVERRADVDTLTALFVTAAGKPAKFHFECANLGRNFIMY